MRLILMIIFSISIFSNDTSAHVVKIVRQRGGISEKVVLNFTPNGFTIDSNSNFLNKNTSLAITGKRSGTLTKEQKSYFQTKLGKINLSLVEAGKLERRDRKHGTAVILNGKYLSRSSPYGQELIYMTKNLIKNHVTDKSNANIYIFDKYQLHATNKKTNYLCSETLEESFACPIDGKGMIYFLP